jgi:hypothetical protein
MIGFILGLLLILGLFFAPYMTVGVIMYHYDHTTLGFILILIGIIKVIFSDDGV